MDQSSVPKSTVGEANQAAKIRELEAKIARLEQDNDRLQQQQRPVPTCGKSSAESPTAVEVDESSFMGRLTRTQIERYSRQLLLRGGFGVEGQLKLLSSSVLIVGAGGIGSTVILYLAACGVGSLTIVDFDEIDESNLHRQVIHKAKDTGMNKAESARQAVYALNPTIKCTVVSIPLSTDNALDLVWNHNCVVDASDNPRTRYLINDACVLGKRPLVSGSAMGFEGQLTVYNYKGGPCYRCLYPKPNAAEGCKTCSDNGVLGPVPGIIGVLQSVEVIKVLTGVGEVMYDRLTMYDSLACSFMRIKKPPRQVKCPACGSEPKIRSMKDSQEACETSRGPSCFANGMNVPQSRLPNNLQISCVDYSKIRERGQNHVLLDVRVPEQFNLCTLEGAVNIPLEVLKDRLTDVEDLSDGNLPVFCLCRRGFASTDATAILHQASKSNPKIHSVRNISGGLNAWRAKIDPLFPNY